MLFCAMFSSMQYCPVRIAAKEQGGGEAHIASNAIAGAAVGSN
jgi:hypothetical protein